MTWNDTFLDLHQRCCERYRSGDEDFNGYYDAKDKTFLESIGYKPREFFDFVEDYCDERVPTPSTALLVAAVRRDYFRHVMQGKPGGKILTRDKAPAKAAKLDGIAYLPRIIAKARAKLRGELDPDLMFCCGGDRHFLRSHGEIHPADFLREVWHAGEDEAKISRWVQAQMPALAKG